MAEFLDKNGLIHYDDNIKEYINNAGIQDVRITNNADNIVISFLDKNNTSITNITIPSATLATAGLMSKDDKKTLDNLSTKTLFTIVEENADGTPNVTPGKEDPNVIYIVYYKEGAINNIYNEYIWNDKAAEWEKIGQANIEQIYTFDEPTFNGGNYISGDVLVKGDGVSKPWVINVNVSIDDYIVFLNEHILGLPTDDAQLTYKDKKDTLQNHLNTIYNDIKSVIIIDPDTKPYVTQDEYDILYQYLRNNTMFNVVIDGIHYIGTKVIDNVRYSDAICVAVYYHSLDSFTRNTITNNLTKSTVGIIYINENSTTDETSNTEIHEILDVNDISQVIHVDRGIKYLPTPSSTRLVDVNEYSSNNQYKQINDNIDIEELLMDGRRVPTNNNFGFVNTLHSNEATDALSDQQLLFTDTGAIIHSTKNLEDTGNEFLHDQLVKYSDLHGFNKGVSIKGLDTTLEPFVYTYESIVDSKGLALSSSPTSPQHPDWCVRTIIYGITRVQIAIPIIEYSNHPYIYIRRFQDEWSDWSRILNTSDYDKLIDEIKNYETNISYEWKATVYTNENGITGFMASDLQALYTKYFEEGKKCYFVHNNRKYKIIADYSYSELSKSYKIYIPEFLNNITGNFGLNFNAILDMDINDYDIDHVFYDISYDGYIYLNKNHKAITTDEIDALFE